MFVPGIMISKAFAITDIELNINGANEIKLGKNILTYDPKLSITEFVGNNHAVLIGYAMNPHDISLSNRDILQILDGCSGHERHHYLNQLNGRYIYIVYEREILRVYPDATTMLPIFYHHDYQVMASHSVIVSEIVNKHYGAASRPYEGRVNGYLDYSRFANIFKVNPNVYYDFTNQQSTRFYPDHNFEYRDINEIVEKTINILQQNQEWLSTKETFLTLTGGIDSRVSLAVIHDKKVPLLTYNKTSKNQTEFSKLAYENDMKIVRNIVDDLELTHTVIEIAEDFKDSYLNEHSVYESKHSYGLSRQLLNSKFADKLHIKSNIFELAKLPILKKYYENDGFLYLEQIKKKMPHFLKQETDADKIIDDYLKRNDLSKKRAMNYHYGDLYYQEQRLGNWHSNITQETDNSVDIFILLNSREMINLVTSAQIQYREAKFLQKEWINFFWPVLNFYPVNEGETLYVEYKEVLRKLEFERLKFTGENIIIEDEILMPRFPMNDKVYSFRVTNENNVNAQLDFMTYYANPDALGMLKLCIDGVCYNYQDINHGIRINFKANETKQFEIIYDKIYDRKSWQQAGRLTFK